MRHGIRAVAALAVFPAAGVVLGLSAMVSAATAPQAGDPARGKMLYGAKCGGCHSLDSNRIGPAHRGVVGRPVASVAGYAYSPAIKRLGGVWTRERLNSWLMGPQRLAPGSKMFLTVDDPKDRRDIIAYLALNPGPAAGKRK